MSWRWQITPFTSRAKFSCLSTIYLLVNDHWHFIHKPCKTKNHFQNMLLWSRGRRQAGPSTLPLARETLSKDVFRIWSGGGGYQSLRFSRFYLFIFAYLKSNSKDNSIEYFVNRTWKRNNLVPMYPLRLTLIIIFIYSLQLFS